MKCKDFLVCPRLIGHHVMRPVAKLVSVLVGTLMLSACNGGGSDAGEPLNPACSSWPSSVMLPEDMAGSIITSVAVIDACQILVSGYFGELSYPLDPVGNTKGFVLRWQLDIQGRVHETWRYVLDGPGTDAISSVEWDGNGIRFLGWSDGATPGNTAYGKRDVLIGHLDVNGSMQSLSRIGNERPNRPLALFEIGADGALLVGKFRG